MIGRRVPILGICYGLQFLNVMHGGTLTQHIESAELHEGNVDQKIKLLPSHILASILGLLF